MQRNEDGGIVISCDFCGADWDEVKPMIEGHRGSVLCLECLKLARPKLAPSDTAFECRLCIQEKPAGTMSWSGTAIGGAPAARVCKPCVEQATRAFTKEGLEV